MDFPHRLTEPRIVILVSTTPQPNSQARRIPRIPHMGSTRWGHLHSWLIGTVPARHLERHNLIAPVWLSAERLMTIGSNLIFDNSTVDSGQFKQRILCVLVITDHVVRHTSVMVRAYKKTLGR